MMFRKIYILFVIICSLFLFVPWIVLQLFIYPCNDLQCNSSITGMIMCMHWFQWTNPEYIRKVNHTITTATLKLRTICKTYAMYCTWLFWSNRVKQYFPNLSSTLHKYGNHLILFSLFFYQTLTSSSAKCVWRFCALCKSEIQMW